MSQIIWVVEWTARTRNPLKQDVEVQRTLPVVCPIGRIGITRRYQSSNGTCSACSTMTWTVAPT